MLSGKPDAGRVVWLDVLRLICAIAIVGFHWLRACFSHAAFGRGELRSLIDPYRNPGLGTGQFHYLLLDRTGPPAASLVNDALGWLFGFGWEAVNVFILLSGLSEHSLRDAGARTITRWSNGRASNDSGFAQSGRFLLKGGNGASSHANPPSRR